jgi:DHA1 family bicyclomycin/chloramphenicol resistance-like MFS transporter
MIAQPIRALPLVACVLVLQPWAGACEDACAAAQDSSEACSQQGSGLQDEVGLVQLHAKIHTSKEQHVPAEKQSKVEPSPRHSLWRAQMRGYGQWSSEVIFGFSEFYGGLVMRMARHLPGARHYYRRSVALLSHQPIDAIGVNAEAVFDGVEGVPVGFFVLLCSALLIVGLFRWYVQVRAARSGKEDSKEGGEAASDYSGPFELRWWHIFVLMQLDCMTPITQDSYIPSMPVMAKQLETTESMMGLSLQVNWIFSGFIAFALGIASDKYGRRPALLVALTCYVVGALLAAMSGNVWCLIFARCVQGVGGGSQALCYAIARDCIQDDTERARLFSIFSIAATLAIALAPIAGGLAAVILGWRMVFVLLAGWGLIAFWNVLSTLPETNPKLLAPTEPEEPKVGESEGSRFGPLIDVFYKSLKPLGLMMSMWMMMPILMALLSSMPFVLDLAYDADTTVVFLCMSALAAASLAGSAVCFILIRLTTSWQLLRFGMCCLLASGASFLVAGLLQIDLGLIKFCALPSIYILCLSMIMGPMRSLVAQPFGEAAGAANGLVMSLSGPIGAFFGFSLTWIFQVEGLFAWMIMLGCLAAFHQSTFWGLVGTNAEDDPIFEISEGYLKYLKSKGKGKGK